MRGRERSTEVERGRERRRDGVTQVQPAQPAMSWSPRTDRTDRSCSWPKRLNCSNATHTMTIASRVLATPHSPPPRPPRRATATTGGLRCAIAIFIICILYIQYTYINMCAGASSRRRGAGLECRFFDFVDACAMKAGKGGGGEHSENASSIFLRMRDKRHLF